MNQSTKIGQLFIIAAPSGAGKTSIIHGVISSLEQIIMSISYTTRPKRPDEMDGQDYFYISDDVFSQMVEGGEFMESAKVFGHYYGTSKTWVKDKLAQGYDVILEIDWQGARIIKSQFPDCTQIYILPPSKDSLSDRLTARAQDKGEVIDYRMGLVAQEVQHCTEFDYLVVNETYEEALADLLAIIRASRLEMGRQAKKHERLISNLLV